MKDVPFLCHFCAICDAERLGVPFVLHICAILRTFASGNMKKLCNMKNYAERLNDNCDAN